MSPVLTEWVGYAAALTTTVCWLPQALKILRERQTEGISLLTQSVFVTGIFLWLIYGLSVASPQLVAANAVTLLLAAAILVLKLRYR